MTELEQENALLSAALSEAKSALARLHSQYETLKHQLDWFKRQLFGQKSEKRLDIDPSEQLNLLAGLGVKAPPSLDDVPKQAITYERRAKVRDSASDNVLERSAADMSFLAGMLVDKFAYHLPLYRQHQRLRDSGIEFSRSTLIHWTSRVLAMDETSIKAGREAKGKMRIGWLWPVSRQFPRPLERRVSR